MKTKKSLNKLLSITLTLALILTLAPAFTLTASAVEIEAGLSSGLTVGDKVYFGVYPQTDLGTSMPAGTEGIDWIKADDGKNGGTMHYYAIEPIEWRVLSNSGGELFLMSEKGIEAGKPYNTTAIGITWEYSTIRSWLNGYGAGENTVGTDYSATGDSFIDVAFGAGEQAAILTTTVENPNNPDSGTLGGNNTSDRIFLLSIQEVTDTGLGFVTSMSSETSRAAVNTGYTAHFAGTSGAGSADYWWLRSPGSNGTYAAIVYDDGTVTGVGMGVEYLIYTARPAFNLDLSSVLFTSAASGAGAKPAAVSSTLSAAAAPTGAVKLTVQDAGLTLTGTDTTTRTVETGDSVSITYSGATTGTNNFVSCVIENSGGDVLYYGKLATAASGAASFTVPALANGNYTIKLFAEECNGDNYTDFCSTPVSVPMTVYTAPPSGTAYDVPYIDGDGDAQICPSAAYIDGTETTLTSGWYLASGTVAHSDTLTVAGDVHIILEDSCDMTVDAFSGTEGNAGIDVSSGNSLTIYAQSAGASMGKLTATGGDNCAGIGSGQFGNGGSVTINGGSITAVSPYYGAGIGGGRGAIPGGSNGGNGGTIVINGGIVNASGGQGGAGIGGGFDGNFTMITINGGTVTASAGDGAAGIGNGMTGGNNGIIIINAGTVNAFGKTDGAGIGGGNRGNGGTVIITGGTVNAFGEINTGVTGGAGIGGGWGGPSGNSGGTVVISGGVINANGGGSGASGGAGIGGGYGGAGGATLIYGEATQVTAKGFGNANDIGPGSNPPPGVALGIFFAALPEGNMIGTGDVNIGNPVLFTATPAAIGTVAAALSAPFDTAPFGTGTINLLTGLNPTGKTMSFIATSLDTQSINFALPGYTSVPKTGSQLLTAGVSVDFALSPDKSLTSVAGQSTSTLASTGTQSAPIAGSVSVANSKAALVLTDIIHTGLSFNLYSDSGFSAELTSGGTIALTAGGETTVYIKVTAGDASVAYYAITVNRAASGGGTTTTTTPPTPAPKPKGDDGATTDLGGGNTVETPPGQDPVDNGDGSTTLPGGGTITTPVSGSDGSGGVTIEVPPGTVIDNDGRISFPPGSGGGTITDSYGNTFNVPEDAVIILDLDTPLGFFISMDNPFSDIKDSDWFYDAVMFAYSHGIMVGTSTTPMMFSPKADLTRGMIVTILYRLAGNPVVGDARPYNGFTDVVDGTWYSDAVQWAAENGIMSGYGDGRLGPNDYVTREQLATILYRYCLLRGIDVSVGEDTNILSYEDAFDISEYAIPAFQWACGAGIINGKPGGYLDPIGNATRVEVAIVLQRFIEIFA